MRDETPHTGDPRLNRLGWRLHEHVTPHTSHKRTRRDRRSETARRGVDVRPPVQSRCSVQGQPTEHSLEAGRRKPEHVRLRALRSVRNPREKMKNKKQVRLPAPTSN